MQNAGIELTMGTMIAWLFIAVLAAIGKAGVPMGCLLLLNIVLDELHRCTNRLAWYHLANIYDYRHD